MKQLLTAKSSRFMGADLSAAKDLVESGSTVFLSLGVVKSAKDLDNARDVLHFVFDVKDTPSASRGFGDDPRIPLGSVKAVLVHRTAARAGRANGLNDCFSVMERKGLDAIHKEMVKALNAGDKATADAVRQRLKDCDQELNMKYYPSFKDKLQQALEAKGVPVLEYENQVELLSL
jgi:hypothetical protein